MNNLDRVSIVVGLLFFLFLGCLSALKISFKR